MLADVEFQGFFWIAMIFGLIAFAAFSTSKPSDASPLRRIEGKLDLVVQHLQLEYKDPAIPGNFSDEIKALAADPSRKIQAIKLLREQTGVGLKEAKDAVEAYTAGRG